MDEWVKFKVGSSLSQGCEPFDAISHVAHVHAAVDILQTKKIRAGLVFDESKLNDCRLLVTWLSPNSWSNGFRYGNIRFNFSLKRIIQEKKYYWVEAIAYKIPACRILISDKKHDDLKEYNPNDGDGPWWYDHKRDTHFFNNNFCLEFMVEDDIVIERESLVSIDLVNHHKDWCSENCCNPKNCGQLGMHSQKAGALFIATLVGQNQKFDIPFFYLIDENKMKQDVLYYAFSWLYRIVGSKSLKYSGTVGHTDKPAEAIARAVCNAYATNFNDTCELINLGDF